MSTHAFNVPDDRKVDEIVGRCRDALGRWPSTVDHAAGVLTLTYSPDLTAGEAAVLAEVVRAAKSILTRAERNALEADLAALRTFRQQSQAEFMALTATQRDRALFDVVNAQTNVLRALLRD